MQTHDHIDSSRLARGDEGVGAEGAVSDEDVAAAQMPQHAPCQQRIVCPPFAFDCGDPGAAVEVKEAEQWHERKAAAGLLLRSLPVKGGILLAVRHADGGAIHHQHTAAFVRQCSQLLCDV